MEHDKQFGIRLLQVAQVPLDITAQLLIDVPLVQAILQD
jgi:hypothetical protein